MKLWIVIHHHKHGQDVYPVLKSGFFYDGTEPHDPDEPTLAEAIALCDDYDAELAKEGIEWVEVIGSWENHLIPRIEPEEDEDEDEEVICSECGTPLVVKIVDLDGTNLEEMLVCPKPYCPSNN